MDPVITLDALPSASGEAAGAPDRSAASGGGMEKLRELFLNSQDGAGQVEEVAKPSTMDLLQDVISNQLDREAAVDARYKDLLVGKTTFAEGLDGYRAEAREMLTMQMAHNEKSLNGSLILSAGKSAEGFVKTLMRSQ